MVNPCGRCNTLHLPSCRLPTPTRYSFHVADLFQTLPDSPRPSDASSDEPLAARMRPRSLDEIAGQSHILAEHKLLRRAIESDRFTSLIFYGPPGTGKTSLATVIARTTGSRFATPQMRSLIHSFSGCPKWASGMHRLTSDERSNLPAYQ